MSSARRVSFRQRWVISFLQLKRARSWERRTTLARCRRQYSWQQLKLVYVQGSGYCGMQCQLGGVIISGKDPRDRAVLIAIAGQMSRSLIGSKQGYFMFLCSFGNKNNSTHLQQEHTFPCILTLLFKTQPTRMSQADHLSLILSFYSAFPSSTSHVLTTPSDCTYLVKSLPLPPDTPLSSILQTLEQHQGLSCQYMHCLLGYHHAQNAAQITTVYKYGSHTLQQDILQRAQIQKHYALEEIWQVLYSLTRGLEYLANHNIGYGVLHPSHIFVGQQGVRVLDPSAIAQDPLSPINGRLYSPEVLKGYEDIDILKSDVFVLALCLIQAAVLVQLGQQNSGKHDATRLGLYIQRVSKMYGEDLAYLLTQMTNYHPQDRPSFSEIRQYIQERLEVCEPNEEVDYFSPLVPDGQDNPCTCPNMSESTQWECLDTDEQEDRGSFSGLTEYQRARRKFLPESASPPSLPPLDSSQMASSFVLQPTTDTDNNRKVSKMIKDRLVRREQGEPVLVRQGPSSHGLFTSPQLMADIKRELNEIAAQRRHLRATKQNLAPNFIPSAHMNQC